MGNIPRFYGDQVTLSNVAEVSVGVNSGIVPQTGVSNEHVKAAAGVVGSKLATEAQVRYAKSQVFNLDNGNGTTIDDVAMVAKRAITITAVNIVYVGAQTGTVAAGNIKVGTAAGGEQIVASTAYENSKAVGYTKACTIVDGAVAADGVVFVRHTGVAATQAGEAYVQIEYTVDDAAA